jgi:hypothetical protein
VLSRRNGITSKEQFRTQDLLRANRNAFGSLIASASVAGCRHAEALAGGFFAIFTASGALHRVSIFAAER